MHHVKHVEQKCVKCNKNPVRATDQAYCKECHAAANRISRNKNREEIKRLKALLRVREQELKKAQELAQDLYQQLYEQRSKTSN